jgi:glycosyltransferase involved in cell wall biosynthesis
MQFIPEELRFALEDIGSCDIVIGIPSRHNASTIEFVLQQAANGLNTHFSNLDAVIINSDGFSEDGTRAVVEKFAKTCSIPTFASVYEGPSGKGTAIGMIFEIIDLLNAKVGIMLDADLRSIRPDWIDAFVSPILEKSFDFVAPYY